MADQTEVMITKKFSDRETGLAWMDAIRESGLRVGSETLRVTNGMIICDTDGRVEIQLTLGIPEPEGVELDFE